MSLIAAGRSIPCRVDVPSAYVAKARYALEALLVPLGFDPEWSDRGRIVYGAGPDADEGRTVRLPYAPHVVEFLAEQRPYAAEQAVPFTFEDEKWPALFTDSDGRPDLVASTFLFLSGYQEVSTDARDEHGRVPYEATLPGALEDSERPVVDAYRAVVADLLREAGIDVRPRAWGGRIWALCPTHDIDYMRKARPGVLYREIVEQPLLNPGDRTRAQRVDRLGAFVRQLADGDPYRHAFERMIEEVASRGGTATYFVKAGASDAHDVPYSLTGRYIQERFAELHARRFEIALHPSYGSFDDLAMIRRERAALTSGSSTEPLSIRQHYLRFDPAVTQRLHEEAGFRIDSTLGYADRPGFRRGTCSPFRLFDRDADRPTDVWEMPLAIMESALFRRQGASLAEAVEETDWFTAVCRRFGGACVVLWHNTLWDEIDCPGWGDHFVKTLDGAVSEGALISSLEGALRQWT